MIDDIRYCVSPQARIRDAAGAPIKPFQLIALRSYVRVLDRATVNGQPLVRVALLPWNQELGWVAVSALMTVIRPARPSRAADQLARLVAAVADGRSYGYRAVAHAIARAGGYGDILDLAADERFDGLGGSAVLFVRAVTRHGPAALGLEEVTGPPGDALPGTLLVTRGNQQAGEIAVISAARSVVADAAAILAMYRPVDRE